MPLHHDSIMLSRERSRRARSAAPAVSEDERVAAHRLGCKFRSTGQGCRCWLSSVGVRPLRQPPHLARAWCLTVLVPIRFRMSRGFGAYRPRRRLSLPERAGQGWHRTAVQLGAGVLVATGGVPAAPGGYGHSGASRRQAESVSVRIRQAADGGLLHVETSSAPADEWWHRDQTLLLRWLSEWQQSFDESHRETAVHFPIHVEARAERWQQDVEADGIAAPFIFVGNAEVWVAHGAVRGRPVEVTSQRWPSVGLALVSVSPRDLRDRD